MVRFKFFGIETGSFCIIHYRVLIFNSPLHVYQKSTKVSQK